MISGTLTTRVVPSTSLRTESAWMGRSKARRASR